MKNVIDIIMIILCIAGIALPIFVAIYFSIQEGVGTAIMFGVWLYALDAIIKYVEKKK